MSTKMITLKSSDGETFEVEEAVALQSETIKHMIEEDCADNAIPLANVTSTTLAKVIVYCKKHVDVDSSEESKEELKKFDAEFMEIDLSMIYEIILAANYLNVKSLLDLSCQTIADMIPGKNPEELRTLFNVKNDYTPEEEEELKKKNAWAFE